MMEAGALVALGLLYYAGFVAGRMFIAQIPTAQVHPFLANFIDPIGVFIAIGLLGALIGSVNYVPTLTRGRQIISTSVRNLRRQPRTTSTIAPFLDAELDSTTT